MSPSDYAEKVKQFSFLRCREIERCVHVEAQSRLMSSVYGRVRFVVFIKSPEKNKSSYRSYIVISLFTTLGNVLERIMVQRLGI